MPSKPRLHSEPNTTPAVVERGAVYSLEEAAKRMRWRRHSIRQALRTGLVTAKFGSRRYVTGEAIFNSRKEMTMFSIQFSQDGLEPLAEAIAEHLRIQLPSGDTEGLLTKADAAKFCGVSSRTLERWVASDRCPGPRRINGAVRCSTAEMREWIRRDCPDCGETPAEQSSTDTARLEEKEIDHE